MKAASALLMLPLAACQGDATNARGVAPGETYLTVAASGQSAVRPDIAEFLIGFQTTGADAGATSRANAAKMATITEALGRAGVKADAIQTRNLSLNRITYGADRGRFRAENVVAVRVEGDLARVPDALAATTGAGANVVSGPDLRVSDREAASRSAYAAAYKAARARADAYAGAAGMKVARVIAIYDGTASSPMHRGAFATVDAAGAGPPPVAAPEAAPPPFSGGTLASDVTVRVDFALK